MGPLGPLGGKNDPLLGRRVLSQLGHIITLISDCGFQI
jgi:hypothetical protein